MQSCKKEGQNKVWLSISARPSADKTKFPVLLHKPFFGQQIVCRLQKPGFRCGELPPEAKAENPQEPPSVCKQPHQTRPSRVQRSSAEDRHHTARNYIRFFRQNNAAASGSGNAPRLKYIQASPLSAAHNLPSGLRKLLFRCRYAKPPASRAYI